MFSFLAFKTQRFGQMLSTRLCVPFFLNVIFELTLSGGLEPGTPSFSKGSGAEWEGLEAISRDAQRKTRFFLRNCS